MYSHASVSLDNSGLVCVMMSKKEHMLLVLIKISANNCRDAVVFHQSLTYNTQERRVEVWRWCWWRGALLLKSITNA